MQNFRSVNWLLFSQCSTQVCHHILAHCELATLCLASLASHIRTCIVEDRYKDVCKISDLYVEYFSHIVWYKFMRAPVTDRQTHVYRVYIIVTSCPVHIMHVICIFICFYSIQEWSTLENKFNPCSDDVSETTVSCIPKLAVPCSKLGQFRVHKAFFIAEIKLPCPFLNGGVSL